MYFHSFALAFRCLCMLGASLAFLLGKRLSLRHAEGRQTQIGMKDDRTHETEGYVRKGGDYTEAISFLFYLGD